MKAAFEALWASVLRTFVPLLVAAVMSWLVGLGIKPDDALESNLTLFLGAVLGGVYHLAVRLLETYVSPRFGWLLGVGRQPLAYAKIDASGVPVVTSLATNSTGAITQMSVETVQRK